MSLESSAIVCPNEICGICRDPLMKDIWGHQNHRFHGVCITDWVKVKPTCPTCRTTVSTISLLGRDMLFEDQEEVQSGLSLEFSILTTYATISIVNSLWNLLTDSNFLKKANR